MPSIKKCETLLTRLALINLYHGNDGLALTPLFCGSHGLGKTKFHKAAAMRLGSKDVYTIDCSQVGEGDISGLPFAFKNEDGSSEVRFIKYYIFNKLWRIEKELYQKAITTGFLNGAVRLEFDEEGNQYLIENGNRKLVRTKLDIIEDGEDNIYKFGDELSGETKLKLVESGEISIKIILCDELNRADNVVFKNMMNVILEREVNGYKLPFWAMISAAINPASQNSTYNTAEMDPAQNSRFVRIKVGANLEEWIDYALEKHLNTDVVEALAITESIFNQSDKSTEDQTEQTPDPRAWEMVSKMYSSINELNTPKFFNDEERKTVNDDLRVLIRGKVGETAARTLLENINRKENNIKPAEILTTKTKNLDPAIVTKFNNQKRLTQKIISDNLVNYVVSTINEIEKGKKSSDAKLKEKYMNYMSQLKEFTNLLDTATQILFVKRFLKLPNGTQIFSKVSTAFSTQILANIQEAKTAIKDLSNE